MDVIFPQILLLYGCLLAVGADEIISMRKFVMKQTTSAGITPASSISKVSSRLRCAVLCSQTQGCNCISYVFDGQTKTCRIYPAKLPEIALGGEVAYVDSSECCYPPSVKKTVADRRYTSDGTEATYTCTPDLYHTVGNPSINCQWTGQWSTRQFTCRDAWGCYEYSYWEHAKGLVFAKEVCTNGGHRYTKGDDSQAPGCGGCNCCQKVP